MAYSFGIKSAADLFRAFSESVDEYLADDLSSLKAIACAVLGWHLVDWVATNRNVNLGVLRKELFAQCPALKSLRDVADGSKHSDITLRPPTLAEADYHRGDFSKEFSRDFNISRLVVRFPDGSERWFVDEIAAVREFWSTYLPSVGITV